MFADSAEGGVHSSIRWLHFSDLHVGVSGQERLWPRFSTIFHKDLDDLLKRVGPIDVIIFSGDLVQKGDADEYEEFDRVIDEILARFADIQNPPKIITVPGNHDIVRPSSLAPEVVALKQFWSNPELRQGFWGQEGASYRSFLSSVFRNYADWQARAINRGIHVRPTIIGPLSGDASYVVDTPSGRLGVVGLNSTWLQLSAGNYECQLHVDVRQLLDVTGGHPDGWVRANQANLLVTHQPAKWLHPDRPATWENDINPPGRFDVHLFGHMHQPETAAIRHGGSLNRLNMQAASLFGLEKYGDDTYERIQGYSANSIRLSDNQRTLTSWPRRLIITTGGRAKLDRDTEQDLDEATGSFKVTYEVENPERPPSPASSASISPSTVALDLTQKTIFDLSVVRFATGEALAHRNVRRVEQETCLHALSSSRVVWLAADWGMGVDGFIRSIREKLGVPADGVFSLDFSAFKERDSFFDALQTRLNVSFQQICETISEVGPAILIFDDVDLASGSNPGLEKNIETLASTVADYASETYVIIRSRRRPRSVNYQTIELVALDEADVAIYASESEIGGSRYSKLDAASQLLRHTDGVPTRIDDALRDLEILSLRDLVAANPDFGDTGRSISDVPQALVASVQELQQSQDRAEQRAYELLLALSALPQGEQLARLKRFLGVHPFGPMHARALLERSLIYTAALTTLDVSADSTDKALLVPRPVRDYIRESMSSEVVWSTDRKALDLYFGEDWTSGNIQNSPTGKRVRAALCDGYEIQNASTLILRNARRSLEAADKVEIETAIRLSLAFIETLKDGDHFRAAASLCEDMVHLLTNYGGHEEQLTKLNYEYGRNLRMIGRAQAARDVFQGLDETHLDKSDKQHAALCLALCYESLGENASAVATAHRAIAINRHTNTALHAKAIIAEQIEDNAAREVELRKLLRAAEKKNAYTIANNIRLELARDSVKRGEDPRAILKEITKNTRSKGDYYNSARAIIDIANLPEAEATMSSEEKAQLIEAYHFLYNERLFNLFDRCHDALWRVFERSGDRANLLNLFRRSSFIWRLNGRDGQEAKYLAKLTKIVHDLIAMGITQANRDGVYLIVRITVVTGTALADLLLEKADEEGD